MFWLCKILWCVGFACLFVRMFVSNIFMWVQTCECFPLFGFGVVLFGSQRERGGGYYFCLCCLFGL